MTIKIPLQVIILKDKGCHLFVDAVINNKIETKLIIDTGASKSVFDINVFGDLIKKFKKR